MDHFSVLFHVLLNNYFAGIACRGDAILGSARTWNGKPAGALRASRPKLFINKF